MEQPAVSVCMITYNHARTIVQAVESVLMQETDFPFELVVGEDGSKDETPRLLRELAGRDLHRIRLSLAAQNRGASVNFRDTLARCQGRFVAMLEGDDFWNSPHKLQRQVDALDQRTDWAICFHPAFCLYEDGMTGPEQFPLDWQRAEATIDDLLVCNFMATGSVMFRRGLFGDLPPWFFNSDLGDWPLHILNAAHGNIGYLPEPMSTYRIHPRGLWSGMDRGTQLSLTFQMLAAVDHHFVGKYSAQISAHRLNTLRWLVGEADRGRRFDELTRQCEALTSRCERLSDDLRALQAKWDARPLTLREQAQRKWSSLVNSVREAAALSRGDASAPAVAVDDIQQRAA